MLKCVPRITHTYRTSSSVRCGWKGTIWEKCHQAVTNGTSLLCKNCGTWHILGCSILYTQPNFSKIARGKLTFSRGSKEAKFTNAPWTNIWKFFELADIHGWISPQKLNIWSQGFLWNKKLMNTFCFKEQFLRKSILFHKKSIKQTDKYYCSSLHSALVNVKQGVRIALRKNRVELELS